MLLLAIAVAGCTAKSPKVALPPAAPPATPPATAPAFDRSGHEPIWQLRSALNVAALGCARRDGGAIIQRYNAVLSGQKPVLAAAYAAEVVRFRRSHGDDWQPALDAYMTGLYNRFAWPPAQDRFCPVASSIAAEAAAMRPAAFEAFSRAALTRIELAFAAPAPAPDPAQSPSLARLPHRLPLPEMAGASSSVPSPAERPPPLRGRASSSACRASPPMHRIMKRCRRGPNSSACKSAMPPNAPVH